jgi:hypothetical protein
MIVVHVTMSGRIFVRSRVVGGDLFDTPWLTFLCPSMQLTVASVELGGYRVHNGSLSSASV